MIGNSRGGSARLPAINHAEAEALISARLDVALDSRQEQILQAHLAACPGCRVFAAQMDVMRTGLRELPRLPASPTVSRQVRERITQPPSVVDRLAGLFGSRLGAAPLAAMAAVLIMAIGAYALFGNDPQNGRLGPTVSAGTQIADQSTTETALAVTETTSQATIPVGQVIPTNTTIPVPNVRAPEETSTTLPQPTDTAAPTETDVAPAPTQTSIPAVAPSATLEPTDEPPATETATEEPTSTEEPTATDIPTDVPTETIDPTETAEPTATETDVPDPTATETDVPDPTATETDVPEPTATETKVPTDVPTETEKPTETAEPTDEPTETGEPTAVPTETEEPTEEPTSTEEPIEESTATEEPPVVGPPTIAPAGDTPVDEATEVPTDELFLENPTETPEDTGDNDPPIESTGGEDVTEESPVDVTEVGGPTDTGNDPQGGDPEEAVAPLDDTRRITGLVSSGGAPSGPLLINTPEASLMVLSADAGGGFLQVVSMGDGGVLAELGASAYPIWSPRGILLLYQDQNNGVPAAALYDRDSGGVYAISNPGEDGAQADIPAGWIGSSAYYLRVTGDENGTVILFGYDVNTGETTEVWRSEGISLAGGRSIPSGDGFLIATSVSWLLVGPGGLDLNLGPADYGLGGEGFLSPDASLVAYPAGGQLVIAGVEAPGIPIGFIPYAGGPGSGFTWSPDGISVAVTDGFALSIYDTFGNQIGVADSANDVTIAAPQWLSDGIYYVETSPEPSLRRLLVEKIPGFGG